MPSKKWKKPKLEDYKIVELTKASHKELSNLPIDLSSTHEELQSRSKRNSNLFIICDNTKIFLVTNQDLNFGVQIRCLSWDTLKHEKRSPTFWSIFVAQMKLIIPSNTLRTKKKLFLDPSSSVIGLPVRSNRLRREPSDDLLQVPNIKLFGASTWVDQS